MTPLTKNQIEAIHTIVAQHTGQCTNDPVTALDEIGLSENKEALRMIDDSIFYCENCSWWCDTDERYEGDLCADCHDSDDEG